MSSIRLCIVFWFLLGISAYYDEWCGPAEISQQYTITSTYSVSVGSTVEWGLFNGFIVYNSSLSPANRDPHRYNGTITQLTILNVTKNNGISYFHFVSGDPVYYCDLVVYKRATTPTCEAVTLTGNVITTKCTTAEVFPRAKCQFSLQNEGTDSRNITDGSSNIIYTHIDPQQGGKEYYSTSCTMQYPVDGLKPGNWAVQVNMYPDQTGVSLDQGTTGQASNTLPLSLPIVSINSTTCPQSLPADGDTNVSEGYIRQGEKASCMCSLTNAGNPRGAIIWTSTKRGSFDILSQSEGASTIQINSPDGPNEVAVSVADNQLNEVLNEPLNLCGSEAFNLNVICAVKLSDVKPALNVNDFKLNKPNAITSEETYLDTLDGEKYTLVNKLKINSGGSHTVICEARNPKFQDIKQTQSVTIEVRKPPREPPKMSARSIQNGDILMEEDDVTVTCEVSGGYPSVQSVTLTCVHDQSVTNNGTSAKLTLKEIGLSYNETNCTCQATHVTGCYDVMGVLPLIVLKRPTQAPEHVQNRVSFVDYIRTRVSDHWEDSEIVIN